jgi:Na+/H+ antiporter NhaD/arsenite permease-like protein
MSTEQILALITLLLVFALGGWRRVHVGALAFAAALGFGLTLASETVPEILAGFPIELMLLLLGMTFLLAVSSKNGTIDYLVDATVRRAGSRTSLLPWVMFAISLLVASLGNPLAAMIIVPIAMSLAQRKALDPVVMGLGAINGSIAGCFAPTSLYGILTVEIGHQGGVSVNPAAQFLFALVATAALQAVAQFLFSRRSRSTGTDPSVGSTPIASSRRSTDPAGGADAAGGVLVADPDAPVEGERDDPRIVRTTPAQRTTMVALVVLVGLVVGLPFAGVDINVGALALGLGVLVCLLFPEGADEAVGQIDWSTILLVGGIVTYVALLRRIGALDRLGDLASDIPWPLLAVFTLCVVGALISAFASTTALLPVLIPLSLPLVTDGSLSGAGLIIALAWAATIVDSMPFSTSGAIMVASASDEDRDRVTSALTRWGLSMVVVGPVVACAVLVLPSAL